MSGRREPIGSGRHGKVCRPWWVANEVNSDFGTLTVGNGERGVGDNGGLV